MGQFLDGKQPLTQLTDDGDTWIVEKEFRYLTDAGDTVLVPLGFITDLASVPRILWNILPPFGRYEGAAVVHDYLYSTQKFERAKCDGILLEAMAAEGVSWLTRRTIYAGVRVGGWLAWREDGAKLKT